MGRMVEVGHCGGDHDHRCCKCGRVRGTEHTFGCSYRSDSANNTQVGGTHYKTEGMPQHWDLMWMMFGEAWFIGCITKYLFRYKKKNGLEDLQKAKHYLEKLIELETEKEQKNESE